MEIIATNLPTTVFNDTKWIFSKTLSFIDCKKLKNYVIWVNPSIPGPPPQSPIYGFLANGFEFWLLIAKVGTLPLEPLTSGASKTVFTVVLTFTFDVLWLFTPKDQDISPPQSTCILYYKRHLSVQVEITWRLSQYWSLQVGYIAESFTTTSHEQWHRASYIVPVMKKSNFSKRRSQLLLMRNVLLLLVLMFGFETLRRYLLNSQVVTSRIIDEYEDIRVLHEGKVQSAVNFPSLHVCWLHIAFIVSGFISAYWIEQFLGGNQICALFDSRQLLYKTHNNPFEFIQLSIH